MSYDKGGSSADTDCPCQYDFSMLQGGLSMLYLLIHIVRAIDCVSPCAFNKADTRNTDSPVLRSELPLQCHCWTLPVQANLGQDQRLLADFAVELHPQALHSAYIKSLWCQGCRSQISHATASDPVWPESWSCNIHTLRRKFCCKHGGITTWTASDMTRSHVTTLEMLPLISGLHFIFAKHQVYKAELTATMKV